MRRIFILVSSLGKRRGIPSSTYDRLESAITEACAELSENSTGALIVLEGHTALTEFISTGVSIQAETITDKLLRNIFYNKAHYMTALSSSVAFNLLPQGASYLSSQNQPGMCIWAHGIARHWD
ncbi:MAG: hypothetical protein HC814_06310 [Rhodobacteraceae bacterium]|nr:hypothetical protein [Paracoccaceae bacterium]